MSSYHELRDWRHVAWGRVLAIARMATVRVVDAVAIGRLVVVAFAWTARRGGVVGGIGESASKLLATSSFPSTQPTTLCSHSEHVLDTAIGTIHQHDLPPTQKFLLAQSNVWMGDAPPSIVVGTWFEHGVE